MEVSNIKKVTMKNFVLILSFLTSFSLQGQDKVDQIFTALGNGNVEDLSKYMHPRVEVHLLDRVSVYNKNTSITALRRFYNQNKPIEYKRIHRGASRAKNSLYSIGKLSTENGDYRVYLYVKRSGEDIYIEEIRIDRE